jgi:hypothetical protein
MTSELTAQQLDEIETRAAYLDEYATLTDKPLQADADQLTGKDVPALIAAVRRLTDRVAELEGQTETATEFRLLPAPPAYTPLIVRRDPAYDGTRWAVLHDPGDLAVRRAWTAEGWEMAWASSAEEIFCWPNAETALAQARRAQGEDDREPDVDGAGRTPESYRSPGQSPAVSSVV